MKGTVSLRKFMSFGLMKISHVNSDLRRLVHTVNFVIPGANILSVFCRDNKAAFVHQENMPVK